MIELPRHPKITKQNLDGSPVYDLPVDVKLPFPGRPLAYVHFYGKTALEVMDEMVQRKTRFDTEEALNAKKPGTWTNIGYVVETKSDPQVLDVESKWEIHAGPFSKVGPETNIEQDRITAYYQIGWQGDLTASA